MVTASRSTEQRSEELARSSLKVDPDVRIGRETMR
jgi:hypothetical protein